ncbi:MAG: hypothetical protein H7Z16_05150 [Pyrinomonadaceae bacterium]|nr:hypothetical protein [Pyrinomonadaceae bacterium]
MITGFNTDIERDGVVYHVQTEDKGLDSPLILSLVYSGGEILAAKRTPYQDLIATGFTDEALAERLKRQHRLICAAINAGRIEELKQMNVRRDEGARNPSAPDVEAEKLPSEPITPPVKVAQPTRKPTASPGKIERPPAEPKAPQFDQAPPKRTEPIVPPARPPVQIQDEFIIETSAARPGADWQPRVEQVVAETAVPEPAVPSLPLPTDPPTRPSVSSSLESAYTVYDSRRPSRQGKARKQVAEIALTILDDEEFRAGENVTIRVLLQRNSGDAEKPLGGIVISIKVLGATFRPQIYSVKTQRDGVAVVSIDLPRFSTGRAAVVVRAEAHEQSVELRRVIHPAG